MNINIANGCQDTEERKMFQTVNKCSPSTWVHQALHCTSLSCGSCFLCNNASQLFVFNLLWKYWQNIVQWIKLKILIPNCLSSNSFFAFLKKLSWLLPFSFNVCEMYYINPIRTSWQLVHGKLATMFCRVLPTHSLLLHYF